MNLITIARLAICVAATSVAAPIYTIADLGSLGGSGSTAFALNASGGAVGWAQTPSGNTEAVGFTGSSLQNLLAGSNWTEGRATGINDAGQVSGTVWQGGVAHGVIWSGGSATDLGANTSAAAVNNSGQVAASGNHALLYQNGSRTDLGVLAGGSWTLAEGLSDNGAVVGYGDSGALIHGFVWTSAGGMTPLGTLGGRYSYAMAINNSGTIAGEAANLAGYLHAAMWQNGTVTDLGTLGGSSSYAWGINSSGMIVGSSWVTGDATTHAFVDINGVMLDLNSLLTPANSGWVLTAAYGINAAGQIAGAGMWNGRQHAFLITDPPGPGTIQPASSAVPEPATLLLVGATLVLLGLRRMHPASRLVTVKAQKR